MTINEISKDFGNIEYKKYTSIAQKREIIHKLVELIEIKDGFAYIDETILDVFKVCEYIKAYTNLKIENGKELLFYEFCRSNGIFDKVENINDVNLLDKMVCTEIDKKLDSYNSVSSVVRRGIDKLIDRIPNEKELQAFAKEIPSVVNKITPARLKYLSQLFGEQKFQNNVTDISSKKKIKDG